MYLKEMMEMAACEVSAPSTQHLRRKEKQCGNNVAMGKFKRVAVWDWP